MVVSGTDSYTKIERLDCNTDKKATVDVALAFLDVQLLIAACLGNLD
jgi:hypothetical protein